MIEKKPKPASYFADRQRLRETIATQRSELEKLGAELEAERKARADAEARANNYWSFFIRSSEKHHRLRVAVDRMGMSPDALLRDEPRSAQPEVACQGGE